MSVSSTASVRVSGRRQRSFRNYLLDPPFQLKYTGFLLSIALLISATLGTLLWSVSREVIAESEETVKQGQETVERGQEVLRESQKVSAVVHMNIIKDPVYGANPELAAVFNESAHEQDLRLEEQQRRLELAARQLEQRSRKIARQQTRMLLGLVLGLSLLVIAIGAAGIVVTHRVAGPIYKMKKLLGYVGDGHLHLNDKLRKGDELQHFFDSFEKMVQSLRQRQQVEIAKLDEAIISLQHTVPEEQLSALKSLRQEMQEALETSPAPSIVVAA
jgi:nitrogen fixation/metabolism regulation signal transduction histidine kinase